MPGKGFQSSLHLGQAHSRRWSGASSSFCVLVSPLIKVKGAWTSASGFYYTSAASNCRKYLVAGNRSVPTTHYLRTPRYTLIHVSSPTFSHFIHNRRISFALLHRESGSNVAIWLFCLFFFWQQPFKAFKDQFNSLSWFFLIALKFMQPPDCLPILWLEPKLLQLWKFRHRVWRRVPSVGSQRHLIFAHKMSG